MITVLPMTFSGGQTLVTPEGWEMPAGEQMIYPLLRIVSPSYLRTMRIPLRGRDFTSADREGSAPVAIINRAFAHHYWPGEDALGKQLKHGRPDSSVPWMTVIGVVDDVRQYGMEAEPRPELYLSYLQSGSPGFFAPRDLVVRTRGEPYAQVATVRRIVRAFDADMPLSEVRSGADIVAGSVAQRRLNMLLIAGFAGAALLLAALGVYGVVSQAVARRTREIGVRIALGADGRDVLRMVLRQGTVMIGAGLLLGLAGALFGAGLLEALLYGVSPLDPATFVTVAALIAAVALLATFVPARRALRVDPVVALQSD
jgi:putative ABC transport system permease protein